jgi:hypothetical protein
MIPSGGNPKRTTLTPIERSFELTKLSLIALCPALTEWTPIASIQKRKTMIQVVKKIGETGTTQGARSPRLRWTSLIEQRIARKLRIPSEGSPTQQTTLPNAQRIAKKAMTPNARTLTQTTRTRSQGELNQVLTLTRQDERKSGEKAKILSAGSPVRTSMIQSERSFAQPMTTPN